MICVLDFETTGLWPELGDLPLEVAAVFVEDGSLREEAHAQYVIGWDPEYVHQRIKSDTVLSMHTRSGLLDEVSKSQLSVEDVEESLKSLVLKHCGQRAIIAGNSVSFDRRFLRCWMPYLNNALHYRMIDVTTLMLANDRWWQASKMSRDEAGTTAHRALPDARGTVELMKHYRDALTRR